MSALCTAGTAYLSVFSAAMLQVELSERFESNQEKSGGKERDEFQSILHQMGIPSPVTKESAGAAYHTHLARQLSDFICKLLEHYGGTIMLVDVYCIFNRVSPVLWRLGLHPPDSRWREVVGARHRTHLAR